VLSSAGCCRYGCVCRDAQSRVELASAICVCAFTSTSTSTSTGARQVQHCSPCRATRGPAHLYKENTTRRQRGTCRCCLLLAACYLHYTIQVERLVLSAARETAQSLALKDNEWRRMRDVFANVTRWNPSNAASMRSQLLGLLAANKRVASARAMQLGMVQGMPADAMHDI
jgi:hypothetical protein